MKPEKSITQKLLAGILMAGLFVAGAGCEGDSFSLYHDQDLKGTPQPVIDEIDPPDEFLAGIESITIFGEHFHPDPEMNRVHFIEYENGESTAELGEVLSAEENVLEVRTGDIVGDSIIIKVEVRTSDLFSEDYPYKLDSAVRRAEGIATSHQPRAVEADSEGNLYIAHVDGGSNVGIARIDEETGEMEIIAERSGWTYQTIRKGPDGGLYLVRPGNVPILYKIEEGGDEDEIWVFGVPRTDDIDFDANGYLWGAGRNEVQDDDDDEEDAALIRLDQDGDYELFPFDADVTALRVYEGSLYAAGSQNGELKVWQFDLDGNSEPGDPEVYFEFGSAVGSHDWMLHSMIFSDEGELFIGTDGEMGIIKIEPEATGWVHFYPELVDPVGLSFTWVPDAQRMYMAKGAGNGTEADLFRIEMQRDGAPQYGRDL